MKTLKHAVTLAFTLLVTIISYAQSVTIGEKDFAAHPSAILEMQSSNKGVLVPRLTYTQRMYIQTNAQAAGLLVYQTDRENGFYYFDGLAWKFLAPETTYELPTLARVATSGLYEDLLNKPTLFSGNYADLVSKPFIPSRLQDLEQDQNYFTTVSRTERERWDAAAAGSSFSGTWNDLLDKPFIPIRLADLQQDSENRTITDAEKTKLASLTNSLFTGSYNDLTEKPFIPTQLRDLEQDNWYAMYVSRAEKELWGDKNYDNLTNKPTIPTHLRDLDQDNLFYMTVTREEKERWNHTAQVNLFSGSWLDLADKPDFSKVAFSGDYDDLFERPTIPRTLEDLGQTTFYRTVTDGEKDMWNNKSSFSGRYADLIGLPDFHKVAVSGMYEDLSGRPKIPNALAELQSDQYNQRVSTMDMLRWDNKSDFSGYYNELRDKPNFSPVAYTGSYTDLTNRPVISDAAATGRYSDLIGIPAWGDWNEIEQLEIGTQARVQNSGTTGKFARIDHVHTIENNVATQNIGTSNQTIVNTAMLHNVLTTSFGNTDATGSGNGDIISAGYESGATKYKLNIRPNVILSGRPRLDNTPDYSDARTIDYIASTRYLHNELRNEINALRQEIVNARAQDFSRQLPVGTIVMWTGTTNTIPQCWEVVDDMAGKFPVGVRSSGGNYQAGRDIDNAGKSGLNEVTLTVAQMPSHNHGGGYFGDHGSGYSRGSGSGSGNFTSPSVGGDQAHENRPPFYGVYFIKKTSNTCN